MEQYHVDQERYHWMKKNIYKRHPKWKKRTWLRMLLYLIWLLFILFALVLTYKSPAFLANMRRPEDAVSGYALIDYLVSGFFYLLILSILPASLALSYRAILYNTCRGTIGSHRNNTLILTEDSLRNIYHIAGQDAAAMNERAFPYKDITRILWNDYYQRFEIYGISTDTDYLDFARDKVASKRRNKGNLKEPYHLYWIFYDRDKFISTIEAKTGLKIEVTSSTED